MRLHPIRIKNVVRALIACITTTIPLWSGYANARGGRAIAYAYQDEMLLLRSQQRGGMVYVSDAVSKRASAPLVVFLHGINPERALHLWLGGGGRDLRPHVEAWLRRGIVRPFLLAAPSQTLDAYRGTALWPSFDLEQFVEATEKALGGRAAVDRTKVVVVGHSGAGCNSSGGLASVASPQAPYQPLAIAAIDICMDDDAAWALSLTPRDVPVHVYWQPRWSRPFDRFRFVFEQLRSDSARCGDVLETIRIRRPDPHNAMVPVALERALQRLLPGGRSQIGPSAMPDHHAGG